MSVNVKRSSFVVICQAMKCMQLRVHRKNEQIAHDNINVWDIFFNVSYILEFVVCFAKVKRLKM